MARVEHREVPGRVMDDRPWALATRVALIIVALIVAVLVVTGVMLVGGYRPDITVAYAKGQVIPPRDMWTRTVHRVASRLLLPSFACVAVASAGLALVRHRAARLLVPVVAGLTVLTASFTGYLLPWDQLALFHVRVGTNISGYHDILFSKNVKYVLIGDREIGTSTLARWFWIHSLGVPLLLVVLLVVIALHTRAVKPRSEAAPTSRK